MGLAYPNQKFQDWFTQQWAMLWGKKIAPEDFPWLIAPFGNLDGIGSDFINQLAEKEGLVIDRDKESRGLISSIDMLHLSDIELSSLSQKVIDFYENTSLYDLNLTVQWNPFFKVFGVVVNKLFSNRINQLNIPAKNVKNAESVKSEIILLIDPISHQVQYTIWLRTNKSNNQVIYSGIYGTCTLPSGKTCVKAVFPLPKGNATVIMNPRVGPNSELILESSGKKFGDAGFYFLLHDSQGNYWSQFIRSFRDRLVIRQENDILSAEQTVTLWHLKVLKFKYRIKQKYKDGK
ncbi:MAG TPA: hypothetical protein VEC36_10980 [Patescibacteria group bacterium]|nr:hypothetical protein [Patescibacteria group bacterium]